MRTWTLAAFTDRSSLPTVVQMKYNEDNVYFAELTASQLTANGAGMGTFIQNGTVTVPGKSVAPSTGAVSEGIMLKCVNNT